MRTFRHKFYHSFPVQLFLLHFRKHQVLLLFWLVLFSTVNGDFAKAFGVNSLFLAPEYLGRVSFYSTLLLGISFSIFMMSWHITTFILHSKRFKFLATTSQPFFKYCLNNSILPLLFLIFFLFKSIAYQRHNELSNTATILLLAEGFICGFFLLIFISFFYFFNADKTILRALQRKMGGPRKILAQVLTKEAYVDEDALKVDNYLNSFNRIKKARNVDHYNRHFLDTIFKQHHFAAVITVGIAFVFLVIIGYLMDYPAFRIPAGASILLFFAVLIGIAGAFTYMLRSWAIPVIVVLVLALNFAIKHDFIDTRSKAYGLDYTNVSQRPVYSFENFNKIFTRSLFEKDRQSTLRILGNWKEKFDGQTGKPKIVFINVSGGGSRSATWTMDVLQRADSLLHGELMRHAILITGASGGMMGAGYFRELYLEKLLGGKIDLYSPVYSSNISKDLLNAVLSSFAITDFFTPFQHFRIGNNHYAKDRGYAFERQFNINTGDALNKTLADYEAPEKAALIPLLICTATVTADGRRMIISPQPVSYLTMPEYGHPNRSVNDIDGIDFCEFFKNQHPKQLLVTSALRMNATFPYVLPNVYLPSNPIVDVMDAGVRDNYGQQTSLRFMHVFRNWINENTSGVVFIQIRDTRKNEVMPIEREKSLSDMILEPLFTMQRNWSSFQDFNQDDLVAYAEHFLKVRFDRIIFEYVPKTEDKAVPMNLHLTGREKTDIYSALDNPTNRSAFRYLDQLMKR